MSCLGRILSVSYPPDPYNSRFSEYKRNRRLRWRFTALQPESSSVDSESTDKSAASFCIIEGPETVQDFAKMQLQEIQDNIRSRRNKIFLHMEEVRRLRIQQRIKNTELGIINEEQEHELPNFPSFIPFLPPLTAANLKVYYATCFFTHRGDYTIRWPTSSYSRAEVRYRRHIICRFHSKPSSTYAIESSRPNSSVVFWRSCWCDLGVDGSGSQQRKAARAQEMQILSRNWVSSMCSLL